VVTALSESGLGYLHLHLHLRGPAPATPGGPPDTEAVARGYVDYPIWSGR
jgi:hypothetical protein